MTAEMKKVVTFRMEKETKNTVKFQEVGDVPVVGYLYVQKHALQALGNARPSEITVTIELK